MRTVARVRIPRVIVLESGIKSFWAEANDIINIFFSGKRKEKFTLDVSSRRDNYGALGYIIRDSVTALFTMGSGRSVPYQTLLRWSDRELEVVKGLAEYFYRKYGITDSYAIHWHNSPDRKNLYATEQFVKLALEGLQRTPTVSIPFAETADCEINLVIKNYNALVENQSVR